ncbi:MAG: hypothetical protein IT290_07545 [Deltaproteobacteria bacterium]|nr:hypothetical protein [Deltaproteobacteria bacterium]
MGATKHSGDRVSGRLEGAMRKPAMNSTVMVDAEALMRCCGRAARGATKH